MRSFAVAVEPCAAPRLAATALIVHGFAAASPWIAHLAAPAAAALSLLALVGLAATLGRVPGPHCGLAALEWDSRGCRARMAGNATFVAVEPGSASRAMASLVSLEIRVGARRLGWLLTRRALPDADFRRLKARIRLMSP